jgi:hypothetical protein
MRPIFTSRGHLVPPCSSLLEKTQSLSPSPPKARKASRVRSALAATMPPYGGKQTKWEWEADMPEWREEKPVPRGGVGCEAVERELSWSGQQLPCPRKEVGVGFAGAAVGVATFHPRKGKPVARRGRKATGLRFPLFTHKTSGRRAAEGIDWSSPVHPQCAPHTASHSLR